jgi:chromosome segregation ATPase
MTDPPKEESPERRAGHSKLVYDKTKHTIVTVRTPDTTKMQTFLEWYGGPGENVLMTAFSNRTLCEGAWDAAAAPRDARITSLESKLAALRVSAMRGKYRVQPNEDGEGGETWAQAFADCDMVRGELEGELAALREQAEHRRKVDDKRENAAEDFSRLHDEVRALRERLVVAEVSIEVWKKNKREADASLKNMCVDKCEHPAEFVCAYEDGTYHCLHCECDRLWKLEDEVLPSVRAELTATTQRLVEAEGERDTLKKDMSFMEAERESFIAVGQEQAKEIDNLRTGLVDAKEWNAILNTRIAELTPKPVVIEDSTKLEIPASRAGGKEEGR